jgi:signal transduction histidine kinase
MYAEMLSGRMVADPDKQQQYLDTLHAESQRLSHLVENVLAYAQLERRGRGGHVETIALGELLERATDRPAQRARQAGMDLQVEAPGDARQQSVRADVAAVEQILFNLVDNACKYAARADDRTVHLEATVTDRSAELRVRDHGPGISRSEARRLFRPFSKSAGEAAHSAPGVGLGLTLSRRLARQTGGDLRVDPTVADGACLTLSLPLA